MRDAWLAAGTALRESLNRQSMAGSQSAAGSSGESTLEPMIGVLGAMVDFAVASRHRPDQPATHSPLPGQSDATAADFLRPISHAMMIAADRSVSYWVGVARIFGSHQASMAQILGLEPVAGNEPGAQRLIAADELRALLREIGDLATREARILQSELSALDESLAETFQPPGQAGPYRRRWRGKV
ncbi:hypothetical protein [Bradyrhizobium sp.]|uniref:hypothetical protein n=1 Tax=Bradyrhizobium sp. TaxID=376 RepID=UPI003C4DBAF3